MRTKPHYHICLLTALLAVRVSSPELCLMQAKQHFALTDKISSLRQCVRDYPRDPIARTAQGQLITLLTASNRYEEAYQEYLQQLALRIPTNEPDLQFYDLMLKTGRYADILRHTAKSPSNGQDFQHDERLFELRIQAFLALGHYREARQALDQWLGMHTEEGLDSGRFAEDVLNLQRTRRYLMALENTQGPTGKPLFTASVPDSLTRWSRRQEIPVTFFKLVPADPADQHPTAQYMLQKDHTEAAFSDLVNEMNRGFLYLSGGNFSLTFKGVETLYANTDDLSVSGSRSSILASRVYVHTIPPLYKRAGEGFVILVDYRNRTEEEAAYMGDGLIHIAFNKCRPMTVMHELLHGLGATHQDWNGLTRADYQFDPNDRGLMTFTKGELLDLGMEEKNRVLLDWPRVATLQIPNEMISQSPTTLLPKYAQNDTPYNSN